MLITVVNLGADHVELTATLGLAEAWNAEGCPQTCGHFEGIPAGSH